MLFNINVISDKIPAEISPFQRLGNNKKKVLIFIFSSGIVDLSAWMKISRILTVGMDDEVVCLVRQSELRRMGGVGVGKSIQSSVEDDVKKKI